MIDYGSCLAFLRSKRVAEKYRLWCKMDGDIGVKVKKVSVKMSGEQIARIIELHEGGMKFVDIAQHMNCHQNTVSKYIKLHETKKAGAEAQGTGHRHVEGCIGCAKCADKAAEGS